MEDTILNNLNVILNNLISKFHTLLDCPERFSGEYGGQKIHHFIDYIQSYKKVKCIADEQALDELGYLLTEHAHTWWLRRKCHFTTWSEAITALQNQYAKQRSAHIIYKDIYGHSYGEYTTEEDFLNDKFELLTELTDPKLSEKNKIDIIFGLLPNDKQSMLECSTISNLLDLKDQILRLKCNKNSADIKQSNVNNVQCEQTKEEINGHKEAVSERNQCDCLESMDIPSTVYMVNDKDPIIKVRRTEDLMPQLKREECEEEILAQQEEFISTRNITNNHLANENSFQIDTDIMNQINNIIDESEMNCDSIRDNLQISSIKSVKESPATTIAFLLNGETTIQTEVLSKIHPAVRILQNKIPRRRKVRCTYCRRYGHKWTICTKRAKDIQLFPEKFLPKPITSADGPKEIEKVVTVNSNSKDDSSNNILTDSVTSIPALVSHTPPVITTSTNTSIAQPVMVTSIAHTLSHSTPLPSVSPAFSHITMSSVPSTFSHTATLTTKLIAPINGPAPNKQLAAKLRNINGPSPKCHQCGTVGFYKSICPNCSPIYNSNQYK